MRYLTALIGFLLAATPCFAQTAGNGGPGAGPFMFSGAVLMIVIGGLIIFLLFVLSRSIGALHHGMSPPHKTAMEILRERFAKGEIDRQEFEEKRDILQR